MTIEASWPPSTGLLCLSPLFLSGRFGHGPALPCPVSCSATVATPLWGRLLLLSLLGGFQFAAIPTPFPCMDVVISQLSCLLHCGRLPLADPYSDSGREGVQQLLRGHQLCHLFHRLAILSPFSEEVHLSHSQLAVRLFLFPGHRAKSLPIHFGVDVVPPQYCGLDLVVLSCFGSRHSYIGLLCLS